MSFYNGYSAFRPRNFSTHQSPHRQGLLLLLLDAGPDFDQELLQLMHIIHRLLA